MKFVMGLCHAVTVLDYGTVVATGPPEIIRNDPRVLDAYLGTAEEEDDDASQASDEVLVVNRLVAGYGEGDVLHEVSLSVPKGAITYVVGPNGAGKSTLLATISGLLKPGAGLSASTASRS